MNELLVFVCDGAPVRGEIVSISTAWQAVLARRNDPPVIRQILGDFVAAATLLSASLKFDGTLIIQAQSKGPISLLVVECSSNLTMRATVKLSVEPTEIDPNATLADLLDAANTGRLVITLDPTERQPGQPPYQGIVALQQDHNGIAVPVKMQQKPSCCTCAIQNNWKPAFGLPPTNRLWVVYCYNVYPIRAVTCTSIRKRQPKAGVAFRR